MALGIQEQRRPRRAPNRRQGDEVVIDEHTYRILEVGIHGEHGAPENNTCLATRVNPNGTLQGNFIIKKTSIFNKDPLIMKNTAIRLRAAHPEIDPRDLAVFECGERAPGELSVSRFIPGASLKKVRQKLRLKAAPSGVIIQRSWETALRTMIALAPLQKNGLIHRDVKDGNLIVQRDRIGLGDIDLLTTTEDVHREQEVDTLVGTPMIMTPEMTKSRYSLNHTTDPYQAGCVVYQELGGRLTDGNLWDTLSARRNGSFKERVKADLEAMKQACPDQAQLPMFRLKGWLEKALANPQKERPQTVEEHWQLLHARPNIQEL